MNRKHNCVDPMSCPKCEDKAELLAAKARIADMLHYPSCWDTAAYPTVESALHEVAMSFRCNNDDCSAAHDAEVRRKVLEEFSYKWLPNLRITDSQSSLNKTTHNLAIDDAVKHALRMAQEQPK